MVAKTENVKWIDGLRGLASILVVVTHLARTVDPDLFRPADSEHAIPRLLQWPFIRVFIQGRLGVSVFSLVTGYVCALKPIRQLKSGNPEAAMTGIAKSAFRRIPRLVFPTTISTVIIWFVCQFGVFRVAKTTDSPWLSYTSPEMDRSMGDAIKSLCYNLIDTWVYGRNIYDPNHWNLLPLLKGAMLVYTALFATMYMQPKYRMMTSLGLWVYYYIGNDSAFGMQFFFGMFLADLSNHAPAYQWANARPWTHTLLSPALLFLGLFLASYPEDRTEYVAWSAYLRTFSTYILPENYDTPRFFSGFGLELISLSIHFSPRIKDILSNKYFSWLAKQSFAVFLIHGTVIRWIYAWCVFGTTLPKPFQDENGIWQAGPYLTVKSFPLLWIWTPLFFVLLYSLSNLWVLYVDPMCARWTFALEKYVLAGSEKSTLSPLPQ